MNSDDGSDISILETEYKELATKLSDVQRNIALIKDESNRASASLKNASSNFGSKAAEISDDINRSNWTGEKPIGPLGQFIELIDNKYCMFLIYVFFNLRLWSWERFKILLRFLFSILLRRSNESKDNSEKILYNKFTWYNCRKSSSKVFYLLFWHFNIRFNVAPNRFEFPTVLSQFRVTNDWACNCLINQTAPERILLFPLRDGDHYHADHIKASRFISENSREVINNLFIIFHA